MVRFGAKKVGVSLPFFMYFLFNFAIFCKPWQLFFGQQLLKFGFLKEQF